MGDLLGIGLAQISQKFINFMRFTFNKQLELLYKTYKMSKLHPHTTDTPARRSIEPSSQAPASVPLKKDSHYCPRTSSPAIPEHTHQATSHASIASERQNRYNGARYRIRQFCRRRGCGIRDVWWRRPARSGVLGARL